MLIAIAERFRPFVHQPGTNILLPLSKLSFEIYPAYIKVWDLSASEPSLVVEFPIEIEGPVSEFTIMQDLEKGCLKVWGNSNNGFFRYYIYPTSAPIGFVCVQEKFPQDNKSPYIPSPYCSPEPVLEMPVIPRLSFGVTKAPDWVLVNRRLILAEILPFWHRLGCLTPSVPDHSTGSAALFDPIEKALVEKDSVSLAEHFKNLYLAGFSGLLCCSLLDRYHQGFGLASVPVDGPWSPLLLLTKGAQLIGRMLISMTKTNEIEILPCVLPELHAGRFCNVECGEFGRIDLEWSKKKARRLVFHSVKDQSICFQFQKDLKSFRLQKKGSKTVSTKSCGEPFSFAANTTYFFDHFES